MSSDSLKQIYSWTFTSNHMLVFTLMKDTDPNVKFSRYFVFLNIAPGESSDGGGRTFNFRNSISFKLTPTKLAELGHALAAFSRKQMQMVGMFSLMVDSSKSSQGSGGKKTAFLNYNEGNADERKSPFLTLTAKSDGGKGIGLMMSIPQALVVSDICQKFFDNYIRLEMDEFVPYKKDNNNNNNNNNYENSHRSNNNNSNNNNTSAPSEDFSFNDASPF